MSSNSKKGGKRIKMNQTTKPMIAVHSYRHSKTQSHMGGNHDDTGKMVS
jgi:hypothetical protein